MMMNDDSPEAIKAMLDVLYTGSYVMGSDTSSDADMAGLMKHLHVYALADRVQIANLKERAQHHIGKLTQNYWGEKGFCDAVEFAYSIAPPGEGGDLLRDSTLKVCAAHAKNLFGDPEEKFETLVANLPDFPMDLLKWQANHTWPPPSEAGFGAPEVPGDGAQNPQAAVRVSAWTLAGPHGTRWR